MHMTYRLATTFLVTLLLGQRAPCGTGGDSSLVAQARVLAHRYPIVDTHIDFPEVMIDQWLDATARQPKTNFDYVKAKEGGLLVPFMSIYTSSDLEGTGKSKQRAEAMIAVVRKMATTWPDDFALVTSPGEVRKLAKSGRILLAMGMENGSPIEGDIRNVGHFHALGIRYITLAHAKWNHLADGSYDTTRHWNGLSPFGVEVVGEMNRLGIMVDISHLTDSAAFHALRVTRAPVIASHSSCRTFTPGFERNISDDLIRAVAAGGGVVQVNFGSDFINDDIRRSSQQAFDAIEAHVRGARLQPDGKEAKTWEAEYWKEHPRRHCTVAEVALHIDHIAKLVGVRYVGFGSDFDGVGDSLPIGLQDASGYPNLLAELLRLGYTAKEIEAISGGNLLRVWEEVERRASPPASNHK
jgi:membrane dipeptidase